MYGPTSRSNRFDHARRDRRAAAVGLGQRRQVGLLDRGIVRERGECRDRHHRERAAVPFGQPDDRGGLEAVAEYDRHGHQHPDGDVRDEAGDVEQRRAAEHHVPRLSGSSIAGTCRR